MALIDRIENVIKAELNALLDKAEDPQKMAANLLLELEECLSECRATAASLICEEKALVRQAADAEKQIQQWQEKAELAISKDREDLAKAALVEKQKLATVITSKTEERTKLTEALAKLNEDATTLQAKIQALRVKQTQFKRHEASLAVRLKAKQVLHSEQMQSSTQKFEQLMCKVERLEAEVESYELGNNSTADAFKKMAQDEQLEQELQALKAKVQNNHAA
ncbi:PspA/IM30 family protein [Pseudoalteromonas fenneropenaei]|uniref:PspA/IM30 family protein n=1 Tax=Pseudoalteromonas fenneropenaei TaxID=1737459 RepID=A0ABV7CLQ5_9GAMM